MPQEVWIKQILFFCLVRALSKVYHNWNLQKRKTLCLAVEKFQIVYLYFKWNNDYN